MTDFHATERFIGGFIVVGVASLLAWNQSQSGEAGLVAVILFGAIAVGSLLSLAGLLELLAGAQTSDPGVNVPVREADSRSSQEHTVDSS